MAVPNFIAKTVAPAHRALVSGTALVVDSFRKLEIGVTAALGRDVAGLFAEPVVTRKGELLEIAWYAEKSGDPRPISALDAEARSAVEADLRRKLDALKPLLTDRSIGSLLTKALVLRDRDGIYAVGQEAVLVDWGLLPDAIEQGDRAAIDRHVVGTLGAFTGLPALEITMSGVPSTAGGPMNTNRGSSANTGLLIAIGVAAAVTLLATLPGVLRALPAAEPGPSAADLATQKAITDAMREKVLQARNALRTVICTPSKSSRPKDAAAVPVDPTARLNEIANQSVVYVVVQLDEAAKPEVPAAADKTPSKSDEGATGPKPQLAGPQPKSAGPQPNNAGPQPKPGQPSPPAATKPQEKPEGGKIIRFSLGSGFFIGPGRVVTNRHVVENAARIFVTNHALGSLRPAKLVVATPNSDIGKPDFAVLSVEADKQPPALPLSFNVRPLTNVVAIGFPGNVTDTDPQYYRLMNGDPTAVPEVVLTAGFVTSIQEPDGPVPRILHGAAIAHGNSGGPLMDYCGRVLGVNTFIRDKSGYYTVNQSLSSRALADFLQQNKVAFEKTDTACNGAAEPLPPAISADAGTGGPPDSGPSNGPAPGPASPVPEMTEPR